MIINHYMIRKEMLYDKHKHHIIFICDPAFHNVR